MSKNVLDLTYSPGALKKLRTARGYTQKALAQAVGTIEQSYQRWEAGVYVPDGNYMLRLQIALSCSADDLVEE